MGSNETNDEKPPHKVTISTFEIAETEVTFEQFDYYCEQAKLIKPDDKDWGRGSRPVINISWDDAFEYCKWLSKITGENYRLPTEAEWEYAAGGGSNNRSKWAGTSSESSLRFYGNFVGTGGKDRFKYTAPVMSFDANPLGLYDMSGNVWEWCQDWYDKDYYSSSPLNNPINLSNGSRRTSRGGSWRNASSRLKVTDRRDFDPNFQDHYIGFRPVRVP